MPAVPLEASIDRLRGVVRRGSLRRHESRIAFAVAAGSVLVLLLAHWAAVSALPGAPEPFHQLAIPAILLAAYLFGLRGALIVTVVPILVSGPMPILAKPDPATWAGELPSLIRVAMFLLIAIVTGFLFDHLRAALDGWRTTAIRVAQREREGMVALARGAEAKDKDTGDHVLRVQLVSERLALETGMDGDEAEALGWAAMLHDVGKLHVPDDILRKPSPLTAEEVAVIRLHTVWGERILAEGEGYEIARHVARWHHEDFDGSGYPDGLRGARIPLPARIVRIADAFDVMTHGRLYQPARALEAAIEEIERCAGRQFDPELARLFIDLVSADSDFASRIITLPRLDPSVRVGAALTD